MFHSVDKLARILANALAKQVQPERPRYNTKVQGYTSASSVVRIRVVLTLPTVKPVKLTDIQLQGAKVTRGRRGLDMQRIVPPSVSQRHPKVNLLALVPFIVVVAVSSSCGTHGIGKLASQRRWALHNDSTRIWNQRSDDCTYESQVCIDPRDIFRSSSELFDVILSTGREQAPCGRNLSAPGKRSEQSRAHWRIAFQWLPVQSRQRCSKRKFQYSAC
mmetsp:Transcript_93534/g.243888  ORF Transcript_93534/g.243888 Transcript_93534/m.243888 type:complete len:218 (+) Transcript_93534:96-749(+)